MFTAHHSTIHSHSLHTRMKSFTFVLKEGEGKKYTINATNKEAALKKLERKVTNPTDYKIE